MDCHRKVTPGVVTDWELSKYSKSNIGRAGCHEARVRQLKQGKHAAAWIAMRAMPTIHAQPMALVDGQKGCDHPQWEMYSTSKHGVRCMLKQTRSVPATVVGSSCQTCHMPDGNHKVPTAWGPLAVRMPLPADRQWAADRTLVLQALGILDPDGRPTARLGAVKAADIARFTEESWQKERDRMIAACREGHSVNFAKQELVGLRGAVPRPADVPRRADGHRAEAVRDVHGPSGAGVQGAFHASPDCALWYGWSELRRDLTEIQELATDMRALKPFKLARGTVVRKVAPPKK